MPSLPDRRFEHSASLTASGKTNRVFRVAEPRKAVRWLVCFDVRGDVCARVQPFRAWKDAEAALDRDWEELGQAGGVGQADAARIPALAWTAENKSKCGRFCCRPDTGPASLRPHRGAPPAEAWLLTDHFVYEDGRPRVYRRASLPACKRLAAELVSGAAGPEASRP